eukprot:COSAG01_NODE_43590_length_428_cov_0.881459_1_plen_22_part_01
MYENVMGLARARNYMYFILIQS